MKSESVLRRGEKPLRNWIDLRRRLHCNPWDRRRMLCRFVLKSGKKIDTKHYQQGSIDLNRLLLKKFQAKYQSKQHKINFFMWHPSIHQKAIAWTKTNIFNYQLRRVSPRGLTHQAGVFLIYLHGTRTGRAVLDVFASVLASKDKLSDKWEKCVQLVVDTTLNKIFVFVNYKPLYDN